MAVGDILTQPETGWKRFNDDDVNIEYLGTGWISQLHSYYAGGSRRGQANTKFGSVRFNFTGDTLVAWVEGDEEEEKEVVVGWEEVEYTVSRVYEGEIMEDELQKVKGLKVV